MDWITNHARAWIAGLAAIWAVLLVALGLAMRHGIRWSLALRRWWEKNSQSGPE